MKSFNSLRNLMLKKHILTRIKNKTKLFSHIFTHPYYKLPKHDKAICLDQQIVPVILGQKSLMSWQRCLKKAQEQEINGPQRAGTRRFETNQTHSSVIPWAREPLEPVLLLYSRILKETTGLVYRSFNIFNLSNCFITFCEEAKQNMHASRPCQRAGKNRNKWLLFKSSLTVW